MQIIEFSTVKDTNYWLTKIGRADWHAASYLYELLSEDTFYNQYGGDTAKVFLLTEGDELISFCTYADKDEIPDSELSPWIGFVYTFPQFRGKRRIGKLIEHIYSLAKTEGRTSLYISTDQKGLYENFGFTYIAKMKTRWGDDTLVYQLKIEHKDYSGIIGTAVKGKIDRPLGSRHPRHKELLYPINYGFVDGVLAGDGAEQDVYVFGTDKPLATFEGTVIAVYHRLNDVEDKWIVSLDDKSYTGEQILNAIAFQEQYFMGELYLPAYNEKSHIQCPRSKSD